MSHRDRFKLKSQIVDALGSWSGQQVNLLFGELRIQPYSGDAFGPDIPDIVGALDDKELVDLYSLTFDLDEVEVVDVVESTDIQSNWKPGYARVFLSHSAIYKDFIGDVSNELAVLGIHGFVAHDTIAYSKPWQSQIEDALRSMQAFVAIVHPEFNDSAFCHEEVGWALGRRVPFYAVRMGKDPAGFLSRDQWPSGYERSAKEVAQIVYRWVSTMPEMGSPIIEGLLEALGEASDYMSAGAAAGRIAALGTLSDADFDKLDAVYWSNNQVHGGVLPSRELRPLYQANNRAWPPPEPPALPADEPPF